MRKQSEKMCDPLFESVIKSTLEAHRDEQSFISGMIVTNSKDHKVSRLILNKMEAKHIYPEEFEITRFRA